MITWKGQLGSLLDEMIDHEDYIIHTGAFCGRQKSIDDPNRFIRNIQDTFKYLEMSRSTRKKFIFTSTWDTDINPYTESKRICQNMVYLWHSVYSIDYLVFVLPSIIGKGIVDSFLAYERPAYMNDRILYFLSLRDVAENIASNITAVNETITIGGNPISVQLLFDILQYAKKSIRPAGEINNAEK